MDVTLELARYAAALRWDALPADVQAKAHASMLDTLACAAAGEKTPQYASLAAALARMGEQGAGSRACAAAFASHVLEYDDAHKRSKTHPGAVIVPAVLETARASGARGHTILAALVAGYEVMLRLGIAVGAAEHRRAGWHATSTAGTIGAAVAAARVLGLDSDGIAQAIGHAVGFVAGNWAFITDDSMTKPLQVGNAARAGVSAAFAAASGVRGVTHGLEAKLGGFFALFGGEPARALDDLESYISLEVATKPYPCCRTVQAGIDAVLALRPVSGPIHVKTFAIAIEQNGFYADGSAARAPFSLPLIIAAAARDGRVDFATFTESNVASLREAERRVTWEIDPELDALYPSVWPSQVEAGGRIEKVLYALGDPRNPMDAAAYARKMEACAGAAAPQLRARVDALLSQSEQPVSVGSL